ncbi:MAG TPA: hypothetical protein VNL39_15265 [Xanthobacteraceae bacterium]|nr:hypothetical protein [Xanthobacteraceae bacterium]
MVRPSLAVLVVAVSAAMVSPADAEKRTTRDLVTLSGCTRYQPVACTMLDAGGTTYYLTGQAVPTKQAVTVTGRKAGDISICFAPAFEVTSWKPNKKLKCP